ncbi:MAG TPA: CBS domain-containing protein [Candidatus Binatia bacterium]
MYRFLESRVADYMTRPVLTVTPETPVHELQRQFVDHDFNGFPVLAAGVLVGVITKFDVLRAFIFTPQAVVPRYDELSRRTAAELMTRDVITFAPETPLTRVLQTLVESRVKSFPVIENGQVVGIIAREDVVRALRDASETVPA